MPAFYITLLVIFCFSVVLFIRYLIRKQQFYASLYHEVTEYTYDEVFHNRGRYGEYLLMCRLAKLPGHKKFLVNLYIPSYQGHTTEVDVLMICETGIHVFEVKNYHGLIIGDIHYKKWQQYLGRRKYSLYNPIWQNEAHVRYLKQNLGLRNPDLFHPLVVFGDFCRFHLRGHETKKCVVRNRQVPYLLQQQFKKGPLCLTREEINHLYEQLIHLSRIGTKVEEEHVRHISSIARSKRNFKS